MRNVKINNGEINGRIIPSFKDFIFYYLNDGDVNVVDEWEYSVKITTQEIMSKNGELVLYSTVTGCMNSFKGCLVDKFHTIGVPTHFQTHIWARMHSKLIQVKFANKKECLVLK